MAYVFKLPPTVTEEIMRYAIGYPSDRLRDIAKQIKRTERQNSRGDLLIEYEGTHLMLLWTHDGQHSPFFRHERLDEARAKYYGEFCESCEPAELQLERTHF